jgi:hypothetical protein
LDSTFFPPAGQWLFSTADAASITPSFDDCGQADLVIQ